MIEMQTTQVIQNKIAVYDFPIRKPTGEIPEEFVRLIESRFVTKRFPKPENTRLTGPQPEKKAN
jgi:hypothetical protein